MQSRACSSSPAWHRLTARLSCLAAAGAALGAAAAGCMPMVSLGTMPDASPAADTTPGPDAPAPVDAADASDATPGVDAPVADAPPIGTPVGFVLVELQNNPQGRDTDPPYAPVSSAWPHAARIRVSFFEHEPTMPSPPSPSETSGACGAYASAYVPYVPPAGALDLGRSPMNFASTEFAPGGIGFARPDDHHYELDTQRGLTPGGTIHVTSTAGGPLPALAFDVTVPGIDFREPVPLPSTSCAFPVCLPYQLGTDFVAGWTPLPDPAAPVELLMFALPEATGWVSCAGTSASGMLTAPSALLSRYVFVPRDGGALYNGQGIVLRSRTSTRQTQAGVTIVTITEGFRSGSAFVMR